MDVRDAQLLTGAKMFPQGVELPDGDFIFLKSGWGGMERAHVLDEGTSDFWREIYRFRHGYTRNWKIGVLR